MKTSFLKVAGVLCCIALSGCAPMSAQGLREVGVTESFSVPGNYQAAYRTLLEEMRRCMQAGMITATVIVHGDLYTDIRKGVITPTMHGGFGAMPFYVVDVVEEDANATRVDVITKTGRNTDAAKLKGVFEKQPFCDR